MESHLVPKNLIFDNETNNFKLPSFPSEKTYDTDNGIGTTHFRPWNWKLLSISKIPEPLLLLS